MISSQTRCSPLPATRVRSAVRLAPVRPARTGVKLSATFQITLKGPEGDVKTFECDDDVYILDAAEEAGLDLPYSCRSGNCSTCMGKMGSGEVDQSDQSCLTEEEVGVGWVSVCVAYPKSDCTILSHQEEAFMMR